MTLLQKRGACLASTLFCLLLFLMSLRAHAQCPGNCGQAIALPSWSNSTYTVSSSSSTVCITGSSAYFQGTINVNSKTNVTLCIGNSVRFASSVTFTNVGSGFKIVNYGTYDPNISLSGNFSGFDNYGSTAGDISVASGTFNFYAGASMGYQNITVSGGTFNNAGSLGSPMNKLTISGGAFASTGAVNMNYIVLSGGSYSNSGSTQINNGFTVSGGTMTTSGSLTVSPTFTPTGGTLNLNGTNTFNNTVTINSGPTANFGGSTTITTFNVGSGGTATFNGRLAVSGNTTVSSTGATLTTNAGFSGGTLTVGSGSTAAFQGSLTLSSQLINNGTVRVPNAASTTCNTATAGSGIQNNGTITAPSGSPMALGSSPSGTGSVGTYVSVATVPASQPTSLSVTPTSDRRIVNGSFTGASGTPAAVGYVVLRRLGSAITASNYPSAGQVATTGSYLNSCKVVARLASGTTTFSDQVDSCGTYYYAVVSSSSSTSGSCATYTTTSSTSGNTNTATPLYNSIAYPQTTYCPNTSSGAGVVTGATGGSFTTNKATLNINTSSGVMSAPTVISDTGSTTVTYSVPARNGCTAFSSSSTVRMSGSALAYVWNGGTSGSLATAGNWNPSRSVLNSCDILVVKNGGSVALSSASTQNFRQLRITNNTNLTLTAASAATLTLSGQSGVGLFIEAGSSLTINTSNLSLKLGNNTVAVINGTLNLSSGVLDASGSNVRLYFGSTSGSFVPLTRTSGTLTTGTTTHLQFGYTGATAMANFTLPNGLFTTNPSSVRALTLMTATATLSLGNQNLIVTDSLRQPSGSGKFILNGNQLTLQGVAVGNPQIDGSAAGSKLSLEGLRDLSGIRFASTNLARLRMNRTYARAMTLPVGADLTITDSIVFVKGIINTGAQKITVATTANLGAENDSSYVYGTLEQQRTLAQNSASAFSNMRISINALGAAPGLTSVTRYNASRTDLGAGTYGTALKYIIHTASTANLNATLTVRLLNSELGGIAPSKLIFARQATGSSVWQPYTGTQKNTGALTYTLTGIGGFSTWTLGDETSGVLPVSLTSFTGKQLSPGRNLLNWITASEENSRGFTVLRSEDGEAYDSLAFVASQPGQMAHHTRYYAYTDNTAPEVAYYRLRQTDYDGRNQTFQPVKIGDAVALKSDALTLYPNPITEDQFTLAYHGKVSTTCDVRLTTQNGRELMHRQYNLVPGWEKMIGLPPLPKGIYILELRLPSGQLLPVRVVRE